MSCHHPVAKPLRLHHQDVVVANMLQSYKREAKLVFPATPRGWAAIEVTTMMDTIAPIWPHMP